LKYSRFIFVLTTVILLLGARVDAALSLEARAAIEEMRARVNHSLQTDESDPSDDRYVPGRELKSVLARYRTRIYGTPDATDGSLAHWRVSVPETRQPSTDYQPGAMLEKALTNYRTQRTVFTLVKVMKAKEAAAHDESNQESVPVSESEHARDPQEKLPESAHSARGSVTVSSSELLTQSQTALDESVETAPKSSSGYKQSSASATNSESSLESASEKVSDESEVQKYEFKMPRNYRIIVK